MVALALAALCLGSVLGLLREETRRIERARIDLLDALAAEAALAVAHAGAIPLRDGAFTTGGRSFTMSRQDAPGLGDADDIRIDAGGDRRPGAAFLWVDR